jgi:hypothetical protein
LREVLAGLDPSRLEGLLPDIIANTNHVKPHIREGYIGLFVFMPTAMTNVFVTHLPAILPSILQGLSDETENVREVSLRAGQAVVNQYALTSLPLILPPLEDGLFDDNWRIRQSSLQLLGDLLAKIVGKSDENDHANTNLEAALGPERRNRILSALYMIRSDPSSVVRQKALLVWKSVVNNTPKALREILPVLMSTIIESFGDESFEKQQVAGKTLGDLVSKLGESILPEIIPILENGLESEDSDTRTGVCLG